MTGPMDSATMGRYAIAFLAIAYLLYQTYERVWRDDMDDPSISIGGNWFLLRLSGIVLVGALVLVAGGSLAPEILRGNRAGMWVGTVLVLLLGYWYISENEEVED